jgi:hypothetical protein
MQPDQINESKVRARRLGVFVLCGVCLVIDGFDVQAMGYVAPAMQASSAGELRWIRLVAGVMSSEIEIGSREFGARTSLSACAGG